MMNRQERKNMIEFIERMKEIDKDTLLYMTDADIEHIYSTVYNSCIELAEQKSESASIQPQHAKAAHEQKVFFTFYS